MQDPFPGVELLTATQVRRWLGIKERRDWSDFLADTADFPKPIQVGKVGTRGQARTKPRLKFRKTEVGTWIMRQPPQEGEAE